VRGWLENAVAREALQIHEWDAVRWLDGDAWSTLVDLSLAVEAVRLAEEGGATPAALRAAGAVARAIRALGPESGYREDRLEALIAPRARTRATRAPAVKSKPKGSSPGAKGPSPNAKRRSPKT
jgi:hypothetical protein